MNSCTSRVHFIVLSLSSFEINIIYHSYNYSVSYDWKPKLRWTVSSETHNASCILKNVKLHGYFQIVSWIMFYNIIVIILNEMLGETRRGRHKCNVALSIPVHVLCDSNLRILYIVSTLSHVRPEGRKPLHQIREWAHHSRHCAIRRQY